MAKIHSLDIRVSFSTTDMRDDEIEYQECFTVDLGDEIESSSVLIAIVQQMTEVKRMARDFGHTLGSMRHPTGE